MADDIDITPGSGKTVATDDVGGRHFQVVKLDVGGDGVSSPVEGALPVVGSVIVTDGQLDLSPDAATETSLASVFEATQQVQSNTDILQDVGTGDEPNRLRVDVAGSVLPTGAATAAKQDTVIAGLSSIDGHVDGIESSLSTIDGHVDDLETIDTAIQTSVQIMDDWDESDRAKVNPIVGQAGVAAGAGAVSATVQRATLASDDPAVASLGVIDDWDESDRAKANIIVGQAGVTAGAGAVAANTPRVTHASDDPVTTSVQLIDDTIFVDDAAFTPATSKVSMAGFQADETATDSVDEGDAGAGRMTLDRKLIVTPEPHTKGGLSVANDIDVDESEDDVKTSAGQLYNIYAYNGHASAVRYLRFYNATAANTTVGTTATFLGPFPIPPGSAFVFNSSFGIPFDTALCVAATTGVAANDTGAPGANDVQVVLGYL
ncbi:MAG: hypothetical protein ACRDH7_09265 [Actinomycetota bacterium]